MTEGPHVVRDEDAYVEHGDNQCRSRYGGERCTRSQGHATEWHTNYGAMEWDDDDED